MVENFTTSFMAKWIYMSVCCAHWLHTPKKKKRYYTLSGLTADLFRHAVHTNKHATSFVYVSELD